MQVIAHGLASSGAFNHFLIGHKLYDPRLISNYIIPFAGEFQDMSVAGFKNMLHYIADINRIDYWMLDEQFTSREFISKIILSDNVELFDYFYDELDYFMINNDVFFNPLKEKCLQYYLKNRNYRIDGIENYLWEFAHLLPPDSNALKFYLEKVPHMFIHFGRNLRDPAYFVYNNLRILWDKKIRRYVKETIHSYGIPDTIKEIEAYEQILELERSFLDLPQQEFENAINNSVAKNKHIQKLNTYFVYFTPKKDIAYMEYRNLLTRDKILQGVPVICKSRQKYINILCEYNRPDLVYKYYSDALHLGGINTFPPVDKECFDKIISACSIKVRSRLYAMCFLYDKTDYIDSKLYYDENEILWIMRYFMKNSLSLETSIAFSQYITVSKEKTLNESNEHLFLLMSSCLEEEDSDTMTEIQLRLLKMKAFNHLDNFLKLSPALWKYATENLLYYEMRYLISRGFRSKPSCITGGQCFDLIKDFI